MDVDERRFLRTSERTSWKRCRQQWHWGWQEGLEPTHTANALEFGSLIHQSLEARYKPGKERGPHPAETFTELYTETIKSGGYTFGQYDEEDEWVDALELGVDMLEHYVDHYGDESNLEIVSPEMPFEVDVPDKNGNYLTTYAGTVDAVYIDHNTGDIGLFEHKTAKSISLGHLPLDEQAGSYWAFAPYVLRQMGILTKDQPLRHILYNTLRKAKRDVRPRNEQGHYLNKNGTVSKRQPSAYFDRTKVYRSATDRANLIYRVRAEAWEINKARAGKMPIYKNPRPGCAGGQGESKCAFYDLCVLHETGAPGVEDMIAMEYRKRDPYEAHRSEE